MLKAPDAKDRITAFITYRRVIPCQNLQIALPFSPPVMPLR